MKLHDAKRVEIIIEAMMERRLCTVIEGAGVTGYTILPVQGGNGRSGGWSREGQVGRAGGMVAVVCLLRPDRVEPVLDAVLSVLERHIGVVNITDAQVIRAERF